MHTALKYKLSIVSSTYLYSAFVISSPSDIRKWFKVLSVLNLEYVFLKNHPVNSWAYIVTLSPDILVLIQMPAPLLCPKGEKGALADYKPVIPSSTLQNALLSTRNLIFRLGIRESSFRSWKPTLGRFIWLLWYHGKRPQGTLWFPTLSVSGATLSIWGWLTHSEETAAGSAGCPGKDPGRCSSRLGWLQLLIFPPPSPTPCQRSLGQNSPLNPTFTLSVTANSVQELLKM